MPARVQDHCYPTEGLQTQNAKYSPVCTVCNWTSAFTVQNCNSYAEQTFKSQCASCNTVCQSRAQWYCYIDHEYIKDHETVGQYTEICHAKDEFIFRNWTADWWNDYQDDLLTADKMGMKQPHDKGVVYTERAAPDPCNDTHIPNSLVTAKKYNEHVDALAKFSVTINKVKGVSDDGVGDVIRGAHALALKDGFNNAKFHNRVCDVCNTATQYTFRCTCNCTCSCQCSCSKGDGSSGRGCSKGCGCSCGCSCTCGCTCPCSTSATTTAKEGIDND